MKTLEDITMKVRSAAALLTDTLALLGERMPGLTQLTLTAGGVTATVVPRPPASPAVCPNCGSSEVRR